LTTNRLSPLDCLIQFKESRDDGTEEVEVTIDQILAAIEADDNLGFCLA